jgi:hypothetical protein
VEEFVGVVASKQGIPKPRSRLVVEMVLEDATPMECGSSPRSSWITKLSRTAGPLSSGFTARIGSVQTAGKPTGGVVVKTTD